MRTQLNFKDVWVIVKNVHDFIQLFRRYRINVETIETKVDILKTEDVARVLLLIENQHRIYSNICNKLFQLLEWRSFADHCKRLTFRDVSISFARERVVLVIIYPEQKLAVVTRNKILHHVPSRVDELDFCLGKNFFRAVWLQSISSTGEIVINNTEVGVFIHESIDV